MALSVDVVTHERSYQSWPNSFSAVGQCRSKQSVKWRTRIDPGPKTLKKLFELLSHVTDSLCSIKNNNFILRLWMMLLLLTMKSVLC